MSVTLRLLADIEEWTYSMLYSIHWTLVSRDFTWINLREHTDWPLPRLISTSPLSLRSEPRAKRTCSFSVVDIGNTLTIFAPTQSAHAQTRFPCMNNRVIISFLLWISLYWGQIHCHMFALPLVEFQFHLQIFQILVKLIIPCRGKAVHDNVLFEGITNAWTCTLRSEYSLREIISNLLMVEPLKGWASWPSSSSQDVTDGNSLGTCGWCWCHSNRVSFEHIRVNSSIRQGLLNPSGNWCWCNWVVGLLEGDNKLRALHSKLGCLFYIYIQSFHRAKRICLIEFPKENFS